MKYYLYILFLFLGLSFLFSCNSEDDFTTDPGAKLEFSHDTIKFDTVFTSIGSATRTLKVYNRNKKSVRISSISVEDPNTKFRFNIDGLPTNVAQDVEIAGQDSIYIFSEVTINPFQPVAISPFIVEDNLIFETNGNEQSVVLEAFGQNANYLPNRNAQNQTSILSCDFNEVNWNSPLPYVIFGILIVNECTLNIPPDTKVYIHGGIAKQVDPMTMETSVFNSGLIYVDSMGHLNANGTVDQPVIFQGDRLEPSFHDQAGQWVGIYMRSTDNNINNAIIKNSLFGVRVDPNASLDISNTRIYNTSSVGLIGIAAQIKADNLLIYNTESFCAQLEVGGNYNFTHCTFASYGVDASALKLSNGLCLNSDCSEVATADLNFDIKNSLIVGSKSDEIVLNDFSRAGFQVGFDYEFSHCLVRVDELVDPNEIDPYIDFYDHCNPCIDYTTDLPLFVDANDDDYHLDTLSIAIDQGSSTALNADIEGNPHNNQPDLGCFEYQN